MTKAGKLSDREVRDTVGCPTCGAKPKQYCVSKKTAEVQYKSHQKRYVAYWEAKGAYDSSPLLRDGGAMRMADRRSPSISDADKGTIEDLEAEVKSLWETYHNLREDISVDCPSKNCGAKAGEPCRTVNGSPAPTHTGRIDARMKAAHEVRVAYGVKRKELSEARAEVQANPVLSEADKERVLKDAGDLSDHIRERLNEIGAGERVPSMEEKLKALHEARVKRVKGVFNIMRFLDGDEKTFDSLARWIVRMDADLIDGKLPAGLPT